MNQQSMFHVEQPVKSISPPTRTGRQIMALTRQAKKYPSAKKMIKRIREKQAWNKFLAK